MILSDATILKIVENNPSFIAPFDKRKLQSSTYDLSIGLRSSLTLEVGKFYLARTIERVCLPDYIQGQVHGRSSIGRLGVIVHFTAGFIDPGFCGSITLEMMAMYKPVTFYHGDRIAQINFARLDRPCAMPYKGRYQYQIDATPSKFEHGLK